MNSSRNFYIEKIAELILNEASKTPGKNFSAEYEENGVINIIFFDVKNEILLIQSNEYENEGMVSAAIEYLILLNLIQRRIGERRCMFRMTL